MCTELDNLIDCVKEAESSLYSKVPQSEIENMKDRIRELEIIEDRAEKVHKAWMEQKIKAGYHSPSDCPVFLWMTLPERAKFSKFDIHCPMCHPGIYPYSELSEDVKEVDRITVRACLGDMLNMKQKIKADFERQKHEREHLVAVSVAWSMLSKRVKVRDIVNVPDLDNKQVKATVVEILKHNDVDPLIGISVEGVIGTTLYPQSSLVWSEEKKEFFLITDDEARRRGYYKWKM